MKRLSFYTTNEIKPRGWIKNQLEIQAKGLSGNLHKVWKDVRDSAWIGGHAEGWERVPYWLDGFIPLAYLLEDEEMIAAAKKYIDAIIASQKEDGWICPCADEEREAYDSWAVQLISKIMTVYYQCSGDERVPDVLYRILKNYYDLLKSEKIKLFNWGKYRWYETFIAMNCVYESHPEEWIKELAQILKTQGMDYNELKPLWKVPLNWWRFDTHIVNITMALKAEAVSYNLLGLPYTDEAEEMHKILDDFNGTPVGLYTGDECLSGLSPVQGTELCAVVEQMYSYEQLYAYTGDSKWAERLEMLAFNALPATISDDMWAHQYVQMSNQIACQRFPGKSFFRTIDNEAHLFGLAPNFGCCTANFNQGWPKFLLSAFMHDEDSIVNVVPIPSALDCDKGSIILETNYPFENSFKYTVKANKNFKFKIRIPSFAENVTVNGSKISDKELVVLFNAGEEKEIIVSFETTPYFEQRPHGLNCVKCGSLVFSVPIKYEKEMREYEKNEVERKFPYCDYEYIPVSEWNYAYCSKELKLEKKSVSDVPFSSDKPPVTIKTTVKNINWGKADGYETVCAKVPESCEPISEAKEIELYPYGCSKLRMTELPIIE